MKKIIGTIIVCGILVISACTHNPDEFQISGKLDKGSGQMINLKEMTSREMIPVDSVVINETGEFSLSGITHYKSYYAIRTSPDNFVYIIAGPGDKILLSGNAESLPKTYEVEGSDDSRLIRELTREQNKTLARIYNLNHVFTDSARSPNFMEIKNSLDTAYKEIVDAQRQYTFSFIEKNISSLASLMALYQQVGPRYYLLEPEKDFKYFAMVDSSLKILYPESGAVKDLSRQVEELRKKQEFEEQSAANLGRGALVPEIALPNPNGDTILLSSLRGKVVLLDFWASWCPPCRRENPNLVEAYKKFSKKGLEIYQVSLDKSREAWLKGIKDDQLDWIHVSDLKYWNSAVVPVFNIQGIPANYLLDRDGKIIDQNLRGSQLIEKLNTVLK